MARWMSAIVDSWTSKDGERCALPAAAQTTIIIATTPTELVRMSVHFMRARYHWRPTLVFSRGLLEVIDHEVLDRRLARFEFESHLLDALENRRARRIGWPSRRSTGATERRAAGSADVQARRPCGCHQVGHRKLERQLVIALE